MPFLGFMFRRVPVCAEYAKVFAPGTRDISLKRNERGENVGMCLLLVFLVASKRLVIFVIMYLFQVIMESRTEDEVNLNRNGTRPFAQHAMASLRLLPIKMLLVVSQIVAEVTVLRYMKRFNRYVILAG